MVFVGKYVELKKEYVLVYGKEKDVDFFQNYIECMDATLKSFEDVKDYITVYQRKALVTNRLNVINITYQDINNSVVNISTTDVTCGKAMDNCNLVDLDNWYDFCSRCKKKQAITNTIAVKIIGKLY